MKYESKIQDILNISSQEEKTQRIQTEIDEISNRIDMERKENYRMITFDMFSSAVFGILTYLNRTNSTDEYIKGLSVIFSAIPIVYCTANVINKSKSIRGLKNERKYLCTIKRELQAEEKSKVMKK